MPRPRFNKLPEEKRNRILEAAAKEFSAHGYENASLNKILETAEISKGAAYYYFDDKADIYTTTLLHFMKELLDSVAFDAGVLTKDNFWSQLAAIYQQQFTHYFERPWVLGMTKTAGLIDMEKLNDGPMAEIWESAQGMMGQLVQRGMELGVIRNDLPESLLQELLMAVDTAHDRWLFEHWAEMTPTEIDHAAEFIADTLRRLLEPAESRDN